MSLPYYTGDGVPLKFTVTDADGAVNPSDCVVHILKPTNEYITDPTVAIDGDEVSYNVGGTATNQTGLYKAYFVVTLPSGLERTHKIEFYIIANPEGNK